MSKAIIGAKYKALKSYGGLIKDKIYVLLECNRLPDPRGWAYDSYSCVFKDVKTRKKVTVTDAGNEEVKRID